MLIDENHFSSNKRIKNFDWHQTNFPSFSFGVEIIDENESNRNPEDKIRNILLGGKKKVELDSN